MKKIALALVLVAMTAGIANAQDKKVTFGAKVGFDITHFWGKDCDHKVQPNYQAGLFMEYKVNDKFGIAPEVVFAAQGGKEDVVIAVDALKFEATEKYNTNYINVPVMFKFYPVSNFSIDFGPQVGFNVYSKSTTKLELKGAELPEGFSEKFTTDYKKATKAVDFGIALGCTYNLSDNAFIQARYTLGLTKVFKGGTIDFNGIQIAKESGLDIKNGNAQIAFGYRF